MRHFVVDANGTEVGPLVGLQTVIQEMPDGVLALMTLRTMPESVQGASEELEVRFEEFDNPVFFYEEANCSGQRFMRHEGWALTIARIAAGVVRYPISPFRYIEAKSMFISGQCLPHDSLDYLGMLSEVPLHTLGPTTPFQIRR